MRWDKVVWCAAAAVSCAVLIWAQPAGSGGSEEASVPAVSQTTNASVPPLIRFSATANDFRSSTQSVSFSLYDSDQSGTPLWSETQQVEIDEQGNYTVMLGSTRPEGLPLGLFSSGKGLWLGVQIADRAEQPRSLMVTVPYAFKAANAETLGGLPASAFLLAQQAGSPGGSGGGQTGTAATESSTAASSGKSRSSSQKEASRTAKPAGPIGPSNPCTSFTTDGTGTANQLAKFKTPCSATKSAVSESGGKVGIGTAAPGGTLDVNGNALVRGTLQLPAKGTAKAAAGFSSQAEDWQASVFDKPTAKPLTEHLFLMAEPVGNNTAAPSAKLSLLSAVGTGAPAESGFSISNKGLIKFAAGQTFPGTGPGTITGVIAGTDLSGGGTHGNVTLNLNTAKTDARYARLATANSFVGNQTIAGRLTATVGSGTAITGSGYTGLAGLGSNNGAPSGVGGLGLLANGGNGSGASGSGGSGLNTFGGNGTFSGGDGADVFAGNGGPYGGIGINVGGGSGTTNGGLGMQVFGGSGTTNGGLGMQVLGGNATTNGGLGMQVLGGNGTTGGTGINASGGVSTDGSSNGVGLIAKGNQNLGVSSSAGSDAIQATGGTGNNANGGNGITSTGGNVQGFASPGIGVVATGGAGNGGGPNGVGLAAFGGANLSATSLGGNAIEATGGQGNFSQGGVGIRALGGSGSSNGGIGGSGLMAEGGNGGTFSDSGGDGADISAGSGGGGSNTVGGVGILVSGGDNAADTGGNGGDGIDATGGNGSLGGNGVVATGGYGADGIVANPGQFGLAGLFGGDVKILNSLNVTGNLSVTGTKMFKIEDPVDPTKYLFHSSVESSEMKNIYDGVAVMDRRGEAVVRLPRWFEALNGEFRYQLTCIGGWQPVFIAKEISHNQFVIGGGTPGMKVSWQVTGVRHDAAAKAHPLVVELAKSDDTFYKREMFRAKRMASAAKRRATPAAIGRHPG